jgi:hypothetical protein
MAKFYIQGVSGEKVLNLTNVQRMLGVYEFLTGQDYGVCCKSIDLCLIQKLSFDNFIAIVNQLNVWVCPSISRKSSRSYNTRSFLIATCVSSIKSAFSVYKTMQKSTAQSCMFAKGL